ncbi:MAG: hypothetical protein ACSLE9_19200 [Burkholderiaceae bacterium]
MGLLERLFGAPRAETFAVPAAPAQEVDPMVVDGATRLIQIFNESLQLANTSVVPATRVSRLELARAKLDELKAMSVAYPYLRLQHLEGAEADMHRISEELSNSGAYAVTDPREREYRHDIHRGVNVEAFQSLIKGRTFIATIQVRTPLRVLNRDGEFFAGVNDPPLIAHEMWEGEWIVQVKTWAELGGADIPAFAPSTRASDIGQIPLDGGEYLVLLKRLRSVVESDRTIEERRESLIAMLREPDWQPYLCKLGGLDRVVGALFVPFISTIKGLTADSIESLFAAGLETPNAIAAVSDTTLRAIRGIGPVKLKTIRAACACADDPACRFVDNVVR